MPSKPQKKTAKRGPEPLRYAHPYFSRTQPVPERIVKTHGATIQQSIAKTLGPVPPTKGDGCFALTDVIGANGSAGLQASGSITFHLGGDSGVPEGDHETKQTMVAEEMAKDYAGADPDADPAFLLHLGDVIYGTAANAYLNEFYRPYMHYPGKIIAIPGNHDGELASKLQDFQSNFCTATPVVPAVAGSIFRETMIQPGVYWCLDAPFVQIIGLYSNNAENPGSISGGTGGPAQLAWLAKTLTALKAERANGVRKALFFITHHPPYSAGGHSGSTAMLNEIDAVCAKVGLGYDAFFSGHAHSEQLYHRTQGGQIVPYVVCGCLGHGGQAISPPASGNTSNPSYEYGYKGWGFATVKVTPANFEITFFGVTDTTQGTTRAMGKQMTYPLAASAPIF